MTLTDAAALPAIARRLSDAGCYRWRREAFDIRAEPDGPVLAQLDRGALPSFGVMAVGVHVNGLVRRRDGLHVWIARRAANKLLDPSKLDHIVAGGVSAGLSPAETLVKEAAEEATIPASLACRAVEVATITYAMERPEGLRRDRLHCYDLELPEDFRPNAADGEVEAFELWPIARVAQTVRDTDALQVQRQPGADRPVPADRADRPRRGSGLAPAYINAGCEMNPGSSWAAKRSSTASLPNFATACTPTGSPSALRQMGRFIAGCPVAENSGVNAA